MHADLKANCLTWRITELIIQNKLYLFYLYAYFTCMHSKTQCKKYATFLDKNYKTEQDCFVAEKYINTSTLKCNFGLNFYYFI